MSQHWFGGRNWQKLKLTKWIFIWKPKIVIFELGCKNNLQMLLPLGGTWRYLLLPSVMIPSFSCPHATECRSAWTLRLLLACLGDGFSLWVWKNSYQSAAKKHVKNSWTHDKRWRLLNTASVGSCRLASRHPSIFFYPLLLACLAGKTQQPKPPYPPPSTPSPSSSSGGSLMALYDMYPPPQKDLPRAESEPMMYSDPAAQHTLREGRFGTKQLHLDEERAPQQVGCKGLTPPQAPAAVRLCSAWRGTVEPGGSGEVWGWTGKGLLIRQKQDPCCIPKIASTETPVFPDYVGV